MSLDIEEHLTSESALSWRRGYRRISSHEDDFADQPRGKDTPLLPVPLSVTSTLTFSFRLFITRLCRCEHLARGDTIQAKMSGPNLITRFHVLGSTMKGSKALLITSWSGFYSEHFNGIAIDSEFARDQAFF